MLAQKMYIELCIYILTWNVGSQDSNDVPMDKLLRLDGNSSCPNSKPDIYVIALQEVSSIVYTQLADLLMENEWLLNMRRLLKDFDFVQLQSRQMQSMLIALYAQRQHVPHLKDIETSTTRTGFAGLWGNMGAVSVRMSLYGTGVCFVSAYLAEHDDQMQKRIDDYFDILKHHYYYEPNYQYISDHEFIFWFGDLNFRLAGNESANEIMQLIKEKKLNKLLLQDQLLLLRQHGLAFDEFSELLPTFAPNFKFRKHSNDYDLQQRPAWCDRILHSVAEQRYADVELGLVQLSYDAHMKECMSDHKPVSAEFIQTIKSKVHYEDELYFMTHRLGVSTTALMWKNIKRYLLS